mmetsp:Transcript_21679/g.26846  ORF Transcript_21679/g.26846 Transcript_21679/m.26846 type:complete len:207 (-) Transcript_21679:564-1184(-)
MPLSVTHPGRSRHDKVRGNAQSLPMHLGINSRGVNHLQPPQIRIPPEPKPNLLQHPPPLGIILHVHPLHPHRVALHAERIPPQLLPPLLTTLRHHELDRDSQHPLVARQPQPRIILQRVNEQLEPILVPIPHETQTVQLIHPIAPPANKIVTRTYPRHGASELNTPRRGGVRGAVLGYDERRRDEDVAVRGVEVHEGFEHEVPFGL